MPIRPCGTVEQAGSCPRRRARRLLPLAAVALVLAPAASGAAATSSLAAFGFAPTLTSPVDQRWWSDGNVAAMQDVFVTEIVATKAFTLIPEARVEALGVSVGGYGGGVDDDRRIAAASRRLGADHGFVGTVTRFRVTGTGARRVVTARVDGRLIDAGLARRVALRRVFRREPVAAAPAATLRARAARAVLPEMMRTLATRLAASRR